MRTVSYGQSSGISRTKSFLAISIASVLSLIWLPVQAGAQNVSSTRDCDNNAVVECGALTTTELRNKYNNDSSVRTIFRHFGISSNDVMRMHSAATVGTVTNSGRVMVDGKTVATNAMTAGRQNMGGSRAVTSDGVTFYERPPSVSFASTSLSAFIVMNNGQFDFAVLTSCGNPVTATPVKKPAKKTPAPAAPTRPAQPQQQQQQQQSVTIVSPTQPVAAAPAPKNLPNTGAGSVLGIGSLVAVVAGLSHAAVRRWRLLT